MIQFLNQKLRSFLFVVLAIVGISFVFFGNWTPHGSVLPQNLGSIDGQPVNAADLSKEIRATRLLFALQTGQFPADNPTVDRFLTMQAWHRMVILNAATKAGFSVPPQQVVDAITSNPLFQDPKTGAYSPAIFERFNDSVLKPQGISLDRFQEILQSELIIDNWLASVRATAVVRPAEVEEAYQSLFGKAKIAYVEVTADSVIRSIQPTEKELRDYYGMNTDHFRSTEKRSFEYVLFPLPSNFASLSPEEQKKARKAASEKAYQFTEPFFAAYDQGSPVPDFTAAVTKAGLKTVSTPLLDRESKFPLGDSNTLTAAGYQLTTDRPVSDYLETPAGYVILHLGKDVPAEVQPFESVASEVRTAYVTQEAGRRLQAKGESLATELRKAIDSGKTWNEATTSLGVSSSTLPAFAPAEPSDVKSPVADAARLWARQLKPGHVGTFTPTASGGAIFYLVSRDNPPDTKRDELLPRVREQLNRQRESQVQEAWLLSLFQAPGNSSPASMDAADGL